MGIMQWACGLLVFVAAISPESSTAKKVDTQNASTLAMTLDITSEIMY
jgi:hypothetical protein